MVTHAHIDRRLLRLVRACVEKVDQDPALLNRIAVSVGRLPNPHIRGQWQSLLKLPWLELRRDLLEESEHGAQLRQNAPFGGLLSNAERLQIFREP